MVGREKEEIERTGSEAVHVVVEFESGEIGAVGDTEGTEDESRIGIIK